jgi:hypothetical protein
MVAARTCALVTFTLIVTVEELSWTPIILARSRILDPVAGSAAVKALEPLLGTVVGSTEQLSFDSFQAVLHVWISTLFPLVDAL